MTVVSARVRDFQSVADSTVTLGDFTVLVGPSNSGKSGFLRGVRACLRNTAVPANVRQGTPKSVVAVEFDAGTVEIERGKSLSRYRLVHDETSETFDKAGRSVPVEIAQLIGLPLIEGVDPTFAFQFDKPFLLSEPGSQAAQVIGSLTNVSTLHTAVREANRRRQEAAGVLKTRQGDITRYITQLKEFAPLKARRTALEQVDSLLAEARQTEQQLAALRGAAARVTQAQQALDTLHAEEPPDVLGPLMEAQELNQQLYRLSAAAGQTCTLVGAITRLVEVAKAHRAEAERLESERAQQLADLGTCPTCGASIVAGPTVSQD